LSDDDLDFALEAELGAHTAETAEEQEEAERMAALDLALLRRLCTQLRLYLRQREMNAFWRMGLMVAELRRPLSARQRAWCRTVETRAMKLQKASRRFNNEQLDRLFAAMPSVPRVRNWRRASRPGASTGPTKGSAGRASGGSP
jgi:hypothetical protein